METGPITVTLDPSRTSIFGLDSGPQTASIDVSLLVDFPLLDVINQPRPSIRIIESGPFVFTDEDHIEATLFGGGTIAPPSIFEGVSFMNGNKYFAEVRARSDSDGDGRPEYSAAIGGTISFNLVPDTGSVSLPLEFGGETVGIEGGGILTVVPEPETYAMFLAGLGLMGFIARRRRQNVF